MDQTKIQDVVALPLWRRAPTSVGSAGCTCGSSCRLGFKGLESTHNSMPKACLASCCLRDASMTSWHAVVLSAVSSRPDMSWLHPQRVTQRCCGPAAAAHQRVARTLQQQCFASCEPGAAEALLVTVFVAAHSKVLTLPRAWIPMPAVL